MPYLFLIVFWGVRSSSFPGYLLCAKTKEWLNKTVANCFVRKATYLSTLDTSVVTVVLAVAFCRLVDEKRDVLLVARPAKTRARVGMVRKNVFVSGKAGRRKKK